MDFHKAKRVSLRNHPELTERWLHERLIEDTTLLGLGDLEVRASERQQLRAGRLDLLLSDPETLTRYEVEIQLGPTDESHIIRTIEYWDIEKRRYPQYEHVAVIVAEDVTSRFLNVISLFNGSIPLVAIQIQGIEVNGAFTLVATRIIDVITLGTEEGEEGEATDRAYWEQKASRDTVQLVDEFVRMIQVIEPELQPKYNKHYIGLANRGVARNFVLFTPRKQHVIAQFKIPRSDELTDRLDESGIEMLPYDTGWHNYRMRVIESDLEEHHDELAELIRIARDSYGA